MWVAIQLWNKKTLYVFCCCVAFIYVENQVTEMGQGVSKLQNCLVLCLLFINNLSPTVIFQPILQFHGPLCNNKILTLFLLGGGEPDVLKNYWSEAVLILWLILLTYAPPHAYCLNALFYLYPIKSIFRSTSGHWI